MSADPQGPPRRDGALVLLLFALFVFVSPFTFWWAGTGAPWYLPYLLWLGLIVLIVPLARRRDHEL